VFRLIQNLCMELHDASCAVSIIRTLLEFLKLGTFIISKPLYQNLACHLKENR
jgi:hypothetical protein